MHVVTKGEWGRMHGYMNHGPCAFHRLAGRWARATWKDPTSQPTSSSCWLYSKISSLTWRRVLSFLTTCIMATSTAPPLSLRVDSVRQVCPRAQLAQDSRNGARMPATSAAAATQYLSPSNRQTEPRRPHRWPYSLLLTSGTLRGAETKAVGWDIYVLMTIWKSLCV